MTFRESINNLIDSTKPQSPTDLIFIVGSLVLIGLWIWATLMRCTIPHIETVMGFLVLCKTVKAVKNRLAGTPDENTP